METRRRGLRRDRPYERLNITGIRGVTEEQKLTLKLMGAIEQRNDGYNEQARFR